MVLSPLSSRYNLFDQRTHLVVVIISPVICPPARVPAVVVGGGVGVDGLPVRSPHRPPRPLTSNYLKRNQMFPLCAMNPSLGFCRGNNDLSLFILPNSINLV